MIAQFDAQGWIIGLRSNFIAIAILTRFTSFCLEDFVKVIGTADAVLLADVYAAGEAPIVAADGRALARALRVAGKVDPVFVDDIALMPQTIVEQARADDVVIAMGAGSIGAVPAQVADMLKGAA